MLSTPPALAQDGPPIAYGDTLFGQVTSPQGALYTFQGQAGDSIVVTVEGINNNFIPTLTLQNPDRSVVLQDLNVGQQTTLTVNATVTTAGTNYLQVNGLNGSVGQFSITLTRGLPAGLPLSLDGPTQGIVAPGLSDVYFDLPLNPVNRTQVEIRSQTPDYQPQVVIYDETSTPIVTMESQRLLAAQFEFAPADETLVLQVSLGEFTDQASFEITVAYPAADSADEVAPIVTQEPSETTATNGSTGSCQVTPEGQSAVRFRSGGSTNHPILGTLQPGQFATATGFNAANNGWYEVTLPSAPVAWIASFTVITTGDCTNLPNKTYPPPPPSGDGSSPATTEEPGDGSIATSTYTATPTSTVSADASETPPTDAPPTATYTPSVTPTTPPAAQVAPPDEEQRFFELNVASPNPNAQQVTISDVISYPGGDTADRIRYQVSGFSQSIFSAEVLITITCSGPGAENAMVAPNFGRNVPRPCSGYSRTVRHTNDSDFGNYEVFLESGNDAYVTWTMTATILSN